MLHEGSLVFVERLADDGRRLLTRFETPKDTPNYYLRDLASKAIRQKTNA